MTLSGGLYAVSHTGQNLPGCISSSMTETVMITLPAIDLSRGPLLDLASTDIVNYRIEQLREKSIRFANVLRSVRMRRAASMQARTNAYLMNNDAVVIDGKETGWVKVQ